MRIAAIVPARNEEDSIEAVLERTREMLQPDELLVVDGASTDATAEVAGCYATVLTIDLPRGAGLNQGVRQTQAEVLLFVHADTLLPHGARAAIEAALADDTVVAGAFRLRFDDPSRPARLLAWNANFRSARLTLFFADQALFVRRDAFEACGGFQPWSLMEDLDLVRRLRRRGRLKLLSAKVTTSARRHRERGWLRTTLTIWGIVALFELGVPPERLARLYGVVR